MRPLLNARDVTILRNDRKEVFTSYNTVEGVFYVKSTSLTDNYTKEHSNYVWKSFFGQFGELGDGFDQIDGGKLVTDGYFFSILWDSSEMSMDTIEKVEEIQITDVDGANMYSCWSRRVDTILNEPIKVMFFLRKK